MRMAIAFALFAGAHSAGTRSGLGRSARARRSCRGEPNLSNAALEPVARRPHKYSKRYAAKYPRRYNWSYYPYWRPYQYRYWQFYYPYGGPLF